MFPIYFISNREQYRKKKIAKYIEGKSENSQDKMYEAFHTKPFT